jgi:hypothetical protein
MEATSAIQQALLGADVQERPACQHHWLIERPSGPTSKGVCRICGEERQFQNYIESSSWGYDVSLEHLAGGSRLPVSVDAPNASAGSVSDEDF